MSPLCQRGRPYSGGGLLLVPNLQGERTPTSTQAELERTPFQVRHPPPISRRIPSLMSAESGMSRIERLEADLARLRDLNERLKAGSLRFSSFELKAENARLRAVLEGLAEFDTDWTLDLDENMARVRAAARRALKERSDG